MPAMLDDPTSPPILHTLDKAAHSFTPEHVTLKDGSNATIIPFTSLSQVPASLVAFLHAQLSAEIEAGDTYPMLDALPLESFGPYWFGVFGAVMLEGEYKSSEDVKDSDADWSKACLGSFYTKPNYPGRSSHVCNAGFLVTSAARNKGVGKQLGRQYLKWAPKLVRVCGVLDGKSSLTSAGLHVFGVQLGVRDERGFYQDLGFVGIREDWTCQEVWCAQELSRQED
jgi:GNAT superfamily N-acetyltransferase